MMTVGDLREMIEGLDDGVEMRIAHQPSYTFEYSIANAVIIGGPLGANDEEEHDEPVVYLVEGSQIGYLPGNVSRTIGWR
jgi:hypothetical protein